jgi:hypothetical protein
MNNNNLECICYCQSRMGGLPKSLRILAVVLTLLTLKTTASWAAIIFSENMGAPPSTTAIGLNAFQNSGTLTFSGSGDVRNTTVSDYTGASGGGNVFLTTAGTRNFVIASIDTTGYSGLTLSFGALKSTVASTMSELVLSYSIDGGSTYSPIAIPAQPTGTGTAVWRVISGIALPSAAEGISDLRLQWMNIAVSGPQFRLDDVKLEGIPAVVPEPSTWVAGALLALPFGVHGVRYLRKRKRA